MQSSNFGSRGPSPGAAASSTRRDNDARSAGILASVLLHAILVLAWRADVVPPPPGPSASPRLMRMSLAIPTVAPPVASTPRPPQLPRPVLARTPSNATLGKVSIPPTALPSLPSIFVESPADGEASPDGEDAGGANARPVPVSILPNWRPPSSAIGMAVVARVLVTASGEASGAVELVPPTPDHGFNRRIAERVSRLEYRPALRDGVPIPDWVEISFVFCRTTVVATSPPAVGLRARPCASGDF